MTQSLLALSLVEGWHSLFSYYSPTHCRSVAGRMTELFRVFGSGGLAEGEARVSAAPQGRRHEGAEAGSRKIPAGIYA